ncbi:Uncharacterised protein [Serratia proteamaculans]|nr:Uncharacterised protein [Serratia proteamaculans]CAI1213004.1 Uncharacterised protein [Serratia proteamaculans]
MRFFLLILGFAAPVSVHALMVIAPTYKYEKQWDQYLITPRVLNYDTANQSANPCASGVPGDPCQLIAIIREVGKGERFLSSADWTPDGGEAETAELRKLKTLGRVLAAQRKNYLTMWYPDFEGGIPNGTCIYLRLGIASGSMAEIYKGPTMSDCVPIYAQVPGCALTPTDINIDFGTLGPGASREVVTPLTLKCPGTSGATLRLSTLPEERLPLGTDGLSQVTFDWGEGYGLPGHFEIMGTQSVTLRARVSSDASASTGTRSGNVGVSISYW